MKFYYENYSENGKFIYYFIWKSIFIWKYHFQISENVFLSENVFSDREFCFQIREIIFRYKILFSDTNLLNIEYLAFRRDTKTLLCSGSVIRDIWWTALGHTHSCWKFVRLRNEYALLQYIFYYGEVWSANKTSFVFKSINKLTKYNVESYLFLHFCLSFQSR